MRLRYLLFLIPILFAIPILTYALTESEKSKAISEADRAMHSAQVRMDDLFKDTRLERQITGKEWLELSEGERMEYVVASMHTLSRYGVIFRQPPNEYYRLIEEKLKANIDLYLSKITDILASIIYEGEPDSRELLDKIRVK